MYVKILKLDVKEIDFDSNESITAISERIDMFFKKCYAESVRSLILYYDPKEIKQLKKLENRIMNNIQKHINEKYMVVSSEINKKNKPHYIRFLVSMQDSDAINTFGDEDYAQILDWVNDALIQSNISPLTEIELECKEY